MYQVLAVVCVLLMTSCNGQFPPTGGSDKCDITPMSREQCGGAGISEVACTNQGCCFATASLPNIPQCYSKNPGDCNVFPSDRDQCGSSSLSEIPCKARGCCYENGLPGAPSCYNKE